MDNIEILQLPERNTQMYPTAIEMKIISLNQLIEVSITQGAAQY